MIFGSFVTFSAVKKYIEQTKPVTVSLVPTLAKTEETNEDEHFAYYLYKELHGYDTDMEEVKDHIKGLGSVLLNPKFPEFPEEDFHLSLTLNLYPFICLTDKRDGQLIVRKKSI